MRIECAFTFNSVSSQKDFLRLGTSPAWLGINEAAWLLGFNGHDIPVLVSGGLLKSLWRPTATGSKYFAAVELQALRTDVRWQAKASDAIANHWRFKNSGRKQLRSNKLALASWN